MRVTIRKWNVFDDWYVIERAEVDGRDWDWETDPVKRSMVCGAASSGAPEGFSADIEGNAYEMRVIAHAIRCRSEDSFKRCSVDARTVPVQLGSPRNDNGVQAELTFEEADELAQQITALLGE